VLTSAGLVHERDKILRPCYSARLVVPFVRALRKYPGFPPALLESLAALDPDTRLPIDHVHELLRGAVALTNDPDLGLKAAREITLGDHGALEYAARSASTWGEAYGVVGRYLRLVNDTLSFALRIEGERAYIQLDNQVSLPRTAADFQSGAFYVSASYFRDPAPAGLETWFRHAQPADLSEYQQTFKGSALRFDAPFDGFALPTGYVTQPVPSADPKLHALLRKHAEALLDELPRAHSATSSVRDVIAKQLSGGTPSLAFVARQLAMSPRTLTRKLEHEHTTFKALLDDLRSRQALRYVGATDLAFSEVAFLLGFSQVAAFHRAFKRWTRQTPLEYRRGQRIVL
jgi:AraC-like DNA-binding protein